MNNRDGVTMGGVIPLVTLGLVFTGKQMPILLVHRDAIGSSLVYLGAAMPW